MQRIAAALSVRETRRAGFQIVVASPVRLRSVAFRGWRSSFSSLLVREAKRLWKLETENAKLKKLLAEAHEDVEAQKIAFGVKSLTPQVKRQAMWKMRQGLTISHRTHVSKRDLSSSDVPVATRLAECRAGSNDLVLSHHTGRHSTSVGSRVRHCGILAEVKRLLQ